jgi:drug/metabolite transporter (DMT)-like permease
MRNANAQLARTGLRTTLADGSAVPTERIVIGILLMIAAVTCFAGLDATAKWVNRTNNPMQTLVVRNVVAFLLVGAACNPLTPVGVPRTRSPYLQSARALCLVLATLTSFLAFPHLPLTQGTSIVFVAPLLVALLAGPMLGEWPGPHRLAAVGVGFAGVLVVTRPWGGPLQPAILLAFVTACANALYAVLTRMLAPRDTPITTMFYTCFVGALVILPIVPFVWSAPAAGLWPAMAATGVFGVVGHFLLTLAHQRAPASTLAPFFYTQLIGATVLAWFLFGETPGRWTVLGGIIITASGLYLLWRERVRGAAPSTTV